MFPFARFPGVDPVLGPEMRSTGEVIGLDRDFDIAFGKSQLGAGTKLPTSGALFVSVREADKVRVLDAVRLLADLGFKVLATGGTARFLKSRASLRSESTRCRKGGRMSWTPSRTAVCTGVQHHGRRAGAGRLRSAARAALLHRAHITPLSPARWRRRKESGLFAPGIWKCGPCRIISVRDETARGI